MDPTVTNIIVIILFFLIFFILTKPKYDIVTYSLIIAIIACILTSLTFDVPGTVFLDYIPFRTIVYLIAINIIIIFIERQKIFQYIAIRIIHITKSNPRLFFYIICTSAALFSGIMEDVSVCVIFIPLVIRATRILKIKIQPYIIGIVISITIGNLLTPYANPSNVLFSDTFTRNTLWFFGNFIGLFVILLIVFLVLIEFKMVRMLPTPDDYQKAILMEIMDPKLLISNRPKFIRHTIYFIIIFVGLIISPIPFLVATIGALIISIIEQDPIIEYIKSVDWKLIFFLIAIFLTIGCMAIGGTLDYVGTLIRNLIGDNLYIALIIIILFSSVTASFTSKNLTIILFSTIFNILFISDFTQSTQQNVLLMALIVGVNLGGTMVPQAASYILKTIEYGQEQSIEGITYQGLLKVLLIFTVISISIGILYVFLYTLISVGL